MRTARRPSSRRPARLVPAALAAVLLAGLGGCGSGDDGTDGADAAAGSNPAAGSTAPGSTAASAPVSTSAAAQVPFGPGCGVFPPQGPGSIAAVATAPLAAAVSTVPQLGTLTQAVLAANLVDVLNTREDVTFLAPSNAAFDALGPDALPGLLADVPRLTAVLTHHVVPGRLTPEQLVGEHTTLNGDTVTVAGPPGAPTVPADRTVATAAPATVVCGGVPTANATVYVVDQVLAPAG